MDDSESVDPCVFSCPYCLDSVTAIRGMRHYECGCIVCADCLEENTEPCPSHEKPVANLQNREVEAMLKQLTVEVKKYEKSYNTDRSEIDALAEKLRQKVISLYTCPMPVSRISSSQAAVYPRALNQQPVYQTALRPAEANQAAPRQAATDVFQDSATVQYCLICHRTKARGVCGCAGQAVVQQWPCRYSDCRFALNPWESWNCQKCGRKYTDSDVEVWQCTCGQRAYGELCSACGAGKQSQQLPASSQSLLCPSCNYQIQPNTPYCPKCKRDTSLWNCSTCNSSNYGVSTNCWYCKAQKPQLTRPNATVKCSSCHRQLPEGTTKCQYCASRRSAAPTVIRKPQNYWTCSCGKAQQPTSQICLICRGENPNYQDRGRSRQ